MIRAGEQGLAQGGTIDDAMSLFAQGSSMSSEDMAQYIAAVKKMDSMPMSDEMKSFNKIYKENGGGVLGFILGVGKNPTVTGQLLVSSIASMINPTVLGGGAVGAGVGAGAGAAAGSVGGPLAIFTAAGGGIAGGLMGMGSTLEFGLSYTEFLREEITKKGLNFDEAGIRKVLNDPEAVQSIRNRAAARGLVIGAVDGLTAGVAGKVGASLTKAGVAAGKSAIKAGGKGALATTGIEAAGGAGGEAAARAVTGQEMDVAEIGFEGITGQASGVLTIPQAAFGMSSTDIIKKGYNEGMNIFKPPVYKIGNDKMTKAEIEKFVDTATLEEAETIQFDVKNDPVLEQKIKNLKVKAENNKTLNPKIQGEDRARILDLEVQLANLGNLEMESTKIEAQQIKSEIKEITERALSSDTKVEPTKKDLELAKEELISEGIVEPSPEQIKTKANAIQESSTEAVDVQEQTSDGKTLGERDTTGPVAEADSQKNQDKTESKEKKEVDATLVAEQEQVREDVMKPVQIPKSRIDVNLNPDGTVKKIIKRGTNTPVNKGSIAKASKYILSEVIDVNEGKTAVIPENVNQNDIPGIIAQESQNVREIANAIQEQEKQIKETVSDTAQQTAEGGIFDIIGLKFTPQSWKAITGVSPKESGISNFWISKDGVSIEDGWVDYNSSLDMETIIDFIEANPTAKKVKELQRGDSQLTSALIDLQVKFKELTGLNPTPTNIKTVMQVDPNREPLVATQEKDVQDSVRKSIDPNEPDFGKKRGPSKQKIIGEPRPKVTVDEKAALKDQLKLEAKAAKEAAREAKRSIIEEQRLKSKRKSAKRNIGAKLGVISTDLDTALQTLFSIDPDLIPDTQLEAYADLVNEFGDRKKVLDLNEKSNTLNKALDIINAVEMEVEVDEDGVLVKEER